MKWLRRLGEKLSNHNAAHGEPVYMYIQCKKCSEKLKLAINKGTDLERVYEEDRGGPAYILKKEAMDSKCFSIMTVRVEFDINKNIISRDITNGRFMTEEEYQRPQSNSNHKS